MLSLLSRPNLSQKTHILSLTRKFSWTFGVFGADLISADDVGSGVRAAGDRVLSGSAGGCSGDLQLGGDGGGCVLDESVQQGLPSIGSLQKKYSIGSFELLSKTTPIQAASLLVLGPIVDYYLSGNLIFDYNFSSGAIIFILLSCSLAVFCNVSQYLCIGRFSAVSFQVLGHMKTVCVLMLGWLLFDSELTFKNIMGMTVAVVGMIIYSWAMELEKQVHTKTLPHAKNSMTEEEFRLLERNSAPAKDPEVGGNKN